MSRLIEVKRAIAYAREPADEHGFLFVSATLGSLLGYQPVDVLADTAFWSRRVHPEDQAEALEGLRQAVQGRRHVQRYRFRHADGRYRWLRDTAEVRLDDEGTPTELLGWWEDVTDQVQTEAELAQRTHDLRERAKELSCLYAMAEVAERPGLTPAEVLQGVVEVVPQGMQFPELVAARLIVDSEEYCSAGFTETAWCARFDVVVHGRTAGALVVCYRQSPPGAPGRVFLKEEHVLLGLIAGRVGRIVERMRAQEDLRKARDVLEEEVRRRTAELRLSN